MMPQSWRSWCAQLGLESSLAMSGAITSSVNCAFAQITPDRTLPNNSSVTTADNIRTISGRTQAGSNLFHSFEEFSVSTGGAAYFNNALDIQNIISWVTRGSVSKKISESQNAVAATRESGRRYSACKGRKVRIPFLKEWEGSANCENKRQINELSNESD